MHSNSQASIPKFGLYGDASQKPEPGFVHIEQIAERSRRHDWQIKPHRHGKLYQVLFIYDGEVDVLLDEKRRKLRGNWAICIPPGTVHGFCFPADTQGEVLTLVDSMMYTSDPVVAACLAAIQARPRFMEFSQQDVLFRQVRQYLHMLRAEISSAEEGHVQITEWLVTMLLINLKRQLDRAPDSGRGKDQVRKQLLQKFRELLELHYREHWSVQRYAETLATSTSSLNRFCLSSLGVTAKTLIQERLLMEIKRRLIYTREAQESIAYKLGFKDPSYFSRFFRNQEGISPGEYRKIKYRETDTSSIQGGSQT